MSEPAELSDALARLLPGPMRGRVAAAGSGGALAGPGGDWFDGAAPQRRAEFRMARDCAVRALEDLGLGGAEVGRDAEGLPRWPEGFVGSITHCKGICAAVAARRRDVALLGLDLERTDRLKPTAAGRVVHPDERDWAGGDLERASLLFCLKEAFYKAQFPQWKVAANFKDLALAVDEARGCARIVAFAKGLGAAFEGMEARFELRFARQGRHALSICWTAAG